MAPQHGNTTGKPGRAVSRGLEGLDFYPVVGLLVALVLITVGVVLVLQGGGRDSEILDRQFAIVREQLAADLRAFNLSEDRIPEREHWEHRTFGDQDEWTATLSYSFEGEPVEDRIRVNFNLETTGYTMRKDDWLAPMEAAEASQTDDPKS
ncbi:MAG: hypothetical protein ACFE0O_09865 [Opitutales bacterium]